MAQDHRTGLHGNSRFRNGRNSERKTVKEILNLSHPDGSRSTIIVDAVRWYRFLERIEMQQSMFDMPEFFLGLIAGIITGTGFVMILTWLRIL